MIGTSIRARLTAWYVAALGVATLTLAGASWWLSTQSVIRAADAGLEARVKGVRDFLENPQTELTVANLQDEFGEYAELTRGEALLEVIEDSGAVLCRPTIPGWTDMAKAEASTRSSGEVTPADRMIDASPFRVASARLDVHGHVYRVTVAAPMGPAYDALNRFHRLLILLLPVVVALAGAGGYWVSRRALRPVDEITQAVRAITVRRLDRRLPLPPADDELRRLAVTFNDVLARLESAVNDIVRFTADASHELRTPVSLLRTTAELALRHERTPDDYRNALTEVLNQARTMSELVDDLLALARTDAGLEPSEMRPLDLRQLASAAADDRTAVASQRSVTISLQAPASPVVVRGDIGSLRRLLVILLDNAVKYSLAGDRVALGICAQADQDPPSAVIHVTDAGIGLDPAERSRLFERFYRGARARQHAPDGTGLGLAIARTIVERHHGSIALTSVDDSGGCDVRVNLPLDAR